MTNPSSPLHPDLYTNRLHLRPLQSSDASAILALHSDPINTRFLDRPLAKTLDDAHAFIEKITKGQAKGRWFFWAISLRDSPELLGTICLWNFSTDRSLAETGYELSSKAQGQGLMQEAFKAVLDYGFQQLQLEEIEAFTHSANQASIRLLEKYQFQHKEALQEESVREGTLVPMAVYSLKRIGLGVILMFLLTWSACSSRPESNANSPSAVSVDTLKSKMDIDSLDLALHAIAKQKVLPGFAVSVFTKDGIIYQKGFGHRDFARTKAYTPNTVQLIASTSKTLVGVALMKAVETGLLQLDDPVEKYLPFTFKNPHFPNQVINLRHLASHTSGLDDPAVYKRTYLFKAPLEARLFPEAWHPLLPKYNGNKARPMGDFLKDILSPDGAWHSDTIFQKQPAGQAYNYSNLGIALLAYVIEQVTEKPFDEYTQATILSPLGMKASTWSLTQVDQAQHSDYFLENYNPLPDYSIITYPDGGLYSSVDDLRLFLQEMIRGYQGESSLLTATSFKEMMRVQFEGEELNDALCWDLSYPCCIGHSGNDFGTATLMYFSPKTGIGRILFTNISLETEVLDDQFYEIFNLLFAYEK